MAQCDTEVTQRSKRCVTIRKLPAMVLSNNANPFGKKTLRDSQVREHYVCVWDGWGGDWCKVQWRPPFGRCSVLAWGDRTGDEYNELRPFWAMVMFCSAFWMYLLSWMWLWKQDAIWIYLVTCSKMNVRCVVTVPFPVTVQVIYLKCFSIMLWWWCASSLSSNCCNKQNQE